MKPTIRNALLFLFGLGGVMHETLVVNIDRPTLLILFAAMMGLPAFLTQAHTEIHPSPDDKPVNQSKDKQAKQDKPLTKSKFIDEYQ